MIHRPHLKETSKDLHEVLLQLLGACLAVQDLVYQMDRLQIMDLLGRIQCPNNQHHQSTRMRYLLIHHLSVQA